MGVRIIVRRGDVVPNGEHLDVGELMLDTGKIRLGIGLGGQQPVWLPGVSPVTNDLLLNPLQGIQGSGFGERYWLGWPGDDFFQIRRNGKMRLGITADYNKLTGYTIMTDGGRTDKDLLFGEGAGIPDFGASTIRNRPGLERIYVVVKDNAKPVAIARPGGMTTLTVRDLALNVASHQEAQASLWRQLYSSGGVSVHQYRQGGSFDPAAKSSLNGYSMANMHSHPDYRNVIGMSEISLLVNGYFIQTRHNDYKMMHSIAGAFGAREECEPVPVPSSVLGLPSGFSGASMTSSGVGTQVEWMRTVYEKNPQEVVVELCYLEAWIQRWDDKHVDMATAPNGLGQGVTSTKYELSHERAQYYGLSGMHPSRENQSTPNGVVVTVDEEGFPQLGYLQYRISSMPVATLSPALVTRKLPTIRNGTTIQRDYTLLPLPYDPELAMQGIIDTRNRLKMRKSAYSRQYDGRTGEQRSRIVSQLEIMNSVHASFDCADLEQLCRMCPGFDGIDQEPRMVMRDAVGGLEMSGAKLDFISANPKGFGFYDNRNSVLQSNASGIKNMRRGFADLNLFSAHTLHPEVLGGWTWMIPLELVLRSPRESWNPTGIANQKTVTGKGTSGDPYSGWSAQTAGRYYTIPYAALPVNSNRPITQADTSYTAYMKSSNGQAVRCWANGVSMFDHDGPTSRRRRRFPVIPEVGMYSQASAETLQFQQRLQPLLKEIRAGRATFDDIDDIFR